MRRRLQELPHNLVWLLGAVAFWCLLWGGVDLKNILGGLLAAILVFVLFPMPPMGHELTLRPLRFAYFLAHFVFDLVRSAIEVGWWAIRAAQLGGGGEDVLPLGLLPHRHGDPVHSDPRLRGGRGAARHRHDLPARDRGRHARGGRARTSTLRGAGAPAAVGDRAPRAARGG